MPLSDKIDCDIQRGSLGDVAVIRLRPNLDLVTGIEQAVREAGFDHAIIRSAVGSLIDATLETGTGDRQIHQGPGVEILSLAGEITKSQQGQHQAKLYGTISRPDQKVFGGCFVRGENAICITLELVIQAWRPESTQ